MYRYWPAPFISIHPPGSLLMVKVASWAFSSMLMAESLMRTMSTP